MEEIEFFEHMLEKTRKVFSASETYANYGDKNWNFAICETPIQKNTGVFFGLNWGGDDKDQQSGYPELIKPRDWNFVSHSRWFLREYLNKEVEQLNYSNLCFFRSPELKQIAPKDWELAIPLFKEYLDYINPPWTLMLGKPNHLWNHIPDHQTEKVFDKKNNRNVFGYTATLFGKYPFAGVPHPQARVSSDARKEIWRKIIDNQSSMK